MLEVIQIVLFALMAGGYFLFIWKATHLPKLNDLKKETITPAQIQVIQAPSLREDPEFSKLIKLLEATPQKVVESVTSTSNGQKGKLGELIGYLHLNSQYDRLIVLRDITDFIGIRFPKDDDPGTIDFIDIKNGAYARLTKEQVALKKIVEGKHIGFKKFKVDTDATSTDTGNES